MSSIRVSLNGKRVHLRAGQVVWVVRRRRDGDLALSEEPLREVRGGTIYFGDNPDYKLNWESVEDGQGTGRVFTTEAEGLRGYVDALDVEYLLARRHAARLGTALHDATMRLKRATWKDAPQ